jgi:protein-S-isoprenylcysteine O-methyltransferase Ste14
MSSSPTAAGNFTVADRPGSKFLKAVAEVLIRRRILISAVLFALLIAQDVAYGPRPHDLADFTNPWTVAGTLMVVTGLALRSWSAGILHKNRELTKAGPYSLIRNPLYVGSFLMMFGFCSLLGDLSNFLVILGPVLVIYIVKVRQEEKLLAATFPQEWPDYSRTTPRFLPRLKRVDVSAPWQFSQWVQHREYQALAATILALVALKVWHSV